MLSSITGKAVHWGVPFSLDFEPTTSCNLGCPECPSGLKKFSRPKGMLDPIFFNQIISQVKGEVFYLMFYFQGEPYLNKNFLEMVNLAKKFKMYVATSTNAHFITEDIANRTVLSGLDRMIISIDGIGQASYEKYRVFGDYSKVISGTKKMVEAKRKLGKGPHLIWQFIVFKHNEHQIEDVKKLGKELGVNEVRIKSAQIYNPEDKKDWIPENLNYSRYPIKEDQIRNSCWRVWHTSVITWDGRVLPCCYDKDAQNQYGKISSSSSWLDIIKSSKAVHFRSELKKNRKSKEICRNCGEGLKVWRK